jgi:uncharacterized membrane protein
MSRVKNALFNFGIGFLVSFAVAALVRDRRAGAKAGVVGGALVATVAWLVYDRLEEIDQLDDVAEFEPADPDAESP